MIAIDSSALIAILTLEPDGRLLLRALSYTRGRIISAMTLLETSIVMLRRSNGGDFWEPLDSLVSEAQIEIVPFDAEQARLAREAYLTYGKGRHPAALNFGDCAAYALAKSKGVPLLYKGADFAKTDIASAL